MAYSLFDLTEFINKWGVMAFIYMDLYGTPTKGALTTGHA